jgi:hypothetical protein
MCQFNPPLDGSIPAAFKSAHDTGRLDVAEHLLRALECLRNGAEGSGAADEAYRIICRDRDGGNKSVQSLDLAVVAPCASRGAP